MIRKLRSKAEQGFTLIELMIVVAIIGILAAVAIPAFMKYIKKSKTTEARQFVKKIYDGARQYYMDEGAKRGSFVLIPKQFPSVGGAGVAGATGLQPTDPTTCCEKCAPDSTLWTDQVWVALQFSVDDPAYYSYEYVLGGEATVGPYTARGNGDLDCDGVFSTFEMYGTINSEYSDGPSGNAGLYRSNDLE